MKNFNDEDFPPYPKMDIVDFARQIIRMDNELHDLRLQVEDLKEYKQKYFDLQNESINHSRVMIGHVLTAALDPESRLNKMQRALAEKEAKSAGEVSATEDETQDRPPLDTV